MKWSVLLLIVLISACTSPETIATEDEVIDVQDCITFEEIETSERCFVVVENLVYNLTEVDSWGHGQLHGGQLACGQDHTPALATMPHTRAHFEPFLIGELC